MENKLRAYMDHLFREVRSTKKSLELKGYHSRLIDY